MKTKLLFPAALCALLLSGALLSAQPALAQTPTPTPAPPPIAQPAEDAAPAPAQNGDRRVIEGDKTVFGGDFTLHADETLTGDLAVFGGTTVLERGSVVEGNIALFGGALDAAGAVQGDLTQIGGTVHLRGSARVGGKVERVSGTRTQDPGAVVRSGGADIEIPGVAPIPPIPPIPPEAPELPVAPVPPAVATPAETGPRATIRNMIRRGPFGVITGNNSVGTSNRNDWKILPGLPLITLLALIVAALLPKNIALAAQTAERHVLHSGGVGILTLLAGSILLGVTLIFIITLCTNPLIALAAVSAGWTVTAVLAGERVMHLFKKVGWTPMTQILAGSAALALLGALPIIGDLAGFLFVALGLGALVLTRGGTQVYTPAVAALVAPSAALPVVIPPSDDGPHI